MSSPTLSVSFQFSAIVSRVDFRVLPWYNQTVKSENGVFKTYPEICRRLLKRGVKYGTILNSEQTGGQWFLIVINQLEDKDEILGEKRKNQRISNSLC